MPGQPRISVIIPNYNKGKFIGAAIESVLTQTFSDFELIVVDDASTDDSARIVESYEKKNGKLSLIRGEKRLGSSGARNIGIKNSKGEVICFLDSDDIYSPAKLEKQLQALQEAEGLVVVYCEWWRIDEDGRTLPPGKRDHPKKSGQIFSDALAQVFGSSTMFMIPKHCFEIVGLYDESLTWAEDYELVLRLAKNFNFKHLDQALYGYRTHQGNKRNVLKRKERLYYEALVTEKYFRKSKNLLDEKTTKKVISNLMRYYSLTGQYKKMLRYGFTSFNAFRDMLLSALKNRPIR